LFLDLIAGHDAKHRFAHHLGRGEAEDSLGGRVPVRDAAVRRERDDRIVRRRDESAQPRAVFELAHFPREIRQHGEQPNALPRIAFIGKADGAASADPCDLAIHSVHAEDRVERAGSRRIERLLRGAPNPHAVVRVDDALEVIGRDGRSRLDAEQFQAALVHIHFVVREVPVEGADTGGFDDQPDAIRTLGERTVRALLLIDVLGDPDPALDAPARIAHRLATRAKPLVPAAPELKAELGDDLVRSPDGVIPILGDTFAIFRVYDIQPAAGLDFVVRLSSNNCPGRCDDGLAIRARTPYDLSKVAREAPDLRVGDSAGCPGHGW
jgi:hypothetical protein